jgi:hypothetical protein
MRGSWHCNGSQPEARRRRCLSCICRPGAPNSHSVADFPAAHRSTIGTTASTSGTVRGPAILQRVDVKSTAAVAAQHRSRQPQTRAPNRNPVTHLEPDDLPQRRPSRPRTMINRTVHRKPLPTPPTRKGSASGPRVAPARCGSGVVDQQPAEGAIACGSRWSMLSVFAVTATSADHAAPQPTVGNEQYDATRSHEGAAVDHERSTL